ncbi:glycosyltransferase family 4 protein [Bacteroides sp.]|uniref:glycosyltransferase family 4 protein n=1 Tax=Bacteroides sp. TaxID=29523 RepID=UPI002632A400|nr:glycosyltransferase family 4 protein [Bacteroides sp.]
MIPFLKEKYEVQLLCSPGKKIDRICREYGIMGHRVCMFRRISLFKDIKSLFQLIRVFHSERPYIVHSMTPKAGLLCMLAAWFTRVPRRVHTFTGLVWPTTSGLYRKILMVTDWLTCACATHVIPEGQGVLNDLQRHITNKPMRVLGYGNVCGVDMVKFSRRPEVIEQANVLKKEDVFTFIFVGRIVGDKGINELVMAFCKLNQKYPYTRLYLVGSYESDLDPVRLDTLNTINTNQAIEAVGSKFADDLLAYYAASDCFVFPSYREGFPNTVLEAGAMGLPCIVTDINGSREIIVNEKNGMIIPFKNGDALYNAMERMLLNKEQTQQFIANARPMIESRFEQGFVRQCLYEFYDEIIS